MLGKDRFNAGWDLFGRLFYFGSLIKENHGEKVVV